MNKGISIIEVIVGASIISITFVATIGVYSSLVQLSKDAFPRVQAAMLVDEGVQALRSMRDEDFGTRIGTLSLDTPYYLGWSTETSSFFATTSPVIVDDMFYRTFVLSSLYRDESHNIASSGTQDEGGRLATVNVSFQGRNGTSTQLIQTYLLSL